MAKKSTGELVSVHVKLPQSIVDTVTKQAELRGSKLQSIYAEALRNGLDRVVAVTNNMRAKL